jgi:hypothetical protein
MYLNCLFSRNKGSGEKAQRNKNCALLCYYAASSGNSLLTFRDNLSVPYSRLKNLRFGAQKSLPLLEGWSCWRYICTYIFSQWFIFILFLHGWISFSVSFAVPYSCLLFSMCVAHSETLVQVLRLCTGRMAHRGSRGIALLFYDHGIRRGWGVSVTPRPLFTPGKDPVPIVQEAGWAPGPVWTGAEKSRPTRFRSPDRLALASRYTDYATRPTHFVWPLEYVI